MQDHRTQAHVPPSGHAPQHHQQHLATTRSNSGSGPWRKTQQQPDVLVCAAGIITWDGVGYSSAGSVGRGTCLWSVTCPAESWLLHLAWVSCLATHSSSSSWLWLLWRSFYTSLAAQQQSGAQLPPAMWCLVPPGLPGAPHPRYPAQVPCGPPQCWLLQAAWAGRSPWGSRKTAAVCARGL